MPTQTMTEPHAAGGGLRVAGAPADTAAARVVCAIVEPDGTIASGTGLSVTYGGTGSYTITFDQPFPLPPAFSLTPGGTTGPLYTASLVIDVSSLSFNYADAQGQPIDSYFSVILIGPP